MISRRAAQFYFYFVARAYTSLVRRMCHLDSGSYIPGHEEDSIIHHWTKRACAFSKVCQFHEIFKRVMREVGYLVRISGYYKTGLKMVPIRLSIRI